MSIDAILLIDNDLGRTYHMLETLIVIGFVAFFAVPTYMHHAETSSVTDAIKKACITAGLIGTCFAIASFTVWFDDHQWWNNWLCVSVVVVGIASVLYYGVDRSRGRHSA